MHVARLLLEGLETFESRPLRRLIGGSGYSQVLEGPETLESRPLHGLIGGAG
jgi:hypothetical protein